MRAFVRSVAAGTVLALATSAVDAGPGGYCPTPPPCATLPGTPWPATTQPGAPGSTDANAPGAAQAPATDAFAQAPTSGGEAAQSAVPNMIGDLFGGRTAYTPVYAIAPGGGQPVRISRSGPVPQNIGAGTVFTVDLFVNGIRVPAGTPLPAALVRPLLANDRIPAGGGSVLPILKIVENENALPQDRVYTTYNYYDNVDGKLNSAPSQENVHREIFGFEKTLLDGNASIGFQLPFFEEYGDDIGNRGRIGDLNIIFKYALLHDRETGSVLSAGLVVTAPTGSDFVPAGFGAPVIHDTLLQPYLSAIYAFNRDWYFQGFTSIVAPTDARDATLFDNDLGVGYFAWRDCSGDRLLTAVVPTVEVHVTTPLTHRGAFAEPVGVSDLVDLTFGTSLGIGKHSYLTLGVAVPVVGPKPFDLEAQMLFNWTF